MEFHICDNSSSATFCHGTGGLRRNDKLTIWLIFWSPRHLQPNFPLMRIIEMKNVRKDYPLGETIVSALKGVNFSVDEGDLLSVVGPSGSGKTTLLNIIGCIDKPSSGEVDIAGQNITLLDDNALTDLRLYTVGFIWSPGRASSTPCTRRPSSRSSSA